MPQRARRFAQAQKLVVGVLRPSNGLVYTNVVALKASAVKVSVCFSSSRSMLWVHVVGSSANPCAEDYRGAEALSEPGRIAYVDRLRRYFDALSDRDRRDDAVHQEHSKSQRVRALRKFRSTRGTR